MATWISIQFEYDVRERVLVNLQYYIRVLEIFVFWSTEAFILFNQRKGHLLVKLLKLKRSLSGQITTVTLKLLLLFKEQLMKYKLLQIWD